MGSSSSSLNLNKALRTLGQSVVDLESHQVWQDVFAAGISQNDVFSMLAPNYIRALRRYRPDNLAVLLYKCVEQLQIFLARQQDPQSAKNAILLITRIMPFVLEKKDVLDDGTVVTDRSQQEDASPWAA